MGFLEQLWDDTVAGPRPDSGLGKLRKYNTFNFRPNSGKDLEGGFAGLDQANNSSNNNNNNQEEVKVTRSIMIVKPPGYNPATGSAPASPAGSITPTSPFSDQEHSVFGENPRQTQMRKQQQRTRADSEALFLLKMSEI